MVCHGNSYYDIAVTNTDTSAKYDARAGNGSLLWSSLRYYHMRLQIVWLSIPSVPTLCLKDPPIGNDTIHPDFLTVGVIRWNKVNWVLATHKEEELSVNN